MGVSTATKVGIGLCVCPVVATPVALTHKPLRDRVASAAGYVPKKPRDAVKGRAKARPKPALAARKPDGGPSCKPDVVIVYRDAPLSSSGSTPALVSSAVGGARPATEPMRFAQVKPNATRPGPGVTPVGVVPEPATWAMMMLGIGAIGMAMRSRRRQTLARSAPVALRADGC